MKFKSLDDITIYDEEPEDEGPNTEPLYMHIKKFILRKSNPLRSNSVTDLLATAIG